MSELSVKKVADLYPKTAFLFSYSAVINVVSLTADGLCFLTYVYDKSITKTLHLQFSCLGTQFLEEGFAAQLI